MANAWEIKAGHYVRNRLGHAGRVTRVECGLAEVAWVSSGKREWTLPQDLTRAEPPCAYGWEIRAKMGPPDYAERVFRWRGLSESAARRRVASKNQSVEILSVLAITREEWIRAYGNPDIKGETRRQLS